MNRYLPRAGQISTNLKLFLSEPEVPIFQGGLGGELSTDFVEKSCLTWISTLPLGMGEIRRRERREVAGDEPLEVSRVVRLGPGRGVVRSSER